MMKKIVSISLLLVLLCGCGPVDTPAAETPSDHIHEINLAPHILDDIGTSMSILEREHPQAEIFPRSDGYPDASAICLGEDTAAIAFVLAGTQGNDMQDVLTYREQLRCCGILTTTGVVFPDMPETISFSDFFTAIGVSEYCYTEDDGVAQGWVNFLYDNKTVWVNVNQQGADGTWHLPEQQELRSDCPIIMTDDAIEAENLALMGW